MRLPKAITSVTQRRRLVRKALGLPAEAPDPLGVTFEPAEDDLLEMIFPLPDEREQAKAKWEAEDYRADVADKIAHAPIELSNRLKRVRAQIDYARAARLVSQSRTLRYRSHHIHPLGMTSDVEGYIEFNDSDLLFPLQITAVGALAKETKSEWEHGEFVAEDCSVLLMGPTILVPGDSVTAEIVPEALNRWYERRFRWVRNHWSHKSGASVEWDIDLAWETQEEYLRPWQDPN